MGRPRTIDREALLDAAESVVARLGAASLTIEAVAHEAGISKAAVLYDGGTKKALVEAVIRRAFTRDDKRHAIAAQNLIAPDDTVIGARIAVAAQPPDAIYGAAALQLSAAVILDEDLRAEMQQRQRMVVDRIKRESGSPTAALLAYLAAEGLKLLEHLDFHHFDPEERARIIDEIGWLSRQPIAPRGPGRENER